MTLYSNLTSIIKSNRKDLKVILLKSGTRRGCPLFPYLCSILCKVLARAIGQLKEFKGLKTRKEEVKLSLFAEDMIVHISNPKMAMRELLQLINTFSNVAGCKINSKKSVALLYTNDKRAEKEIRETSPFTINSHKQHKISWGNTNQRSKRPLGKKL